MTLEMFYVNPTLTWDGEEFHLVEKKYIHGKGTAFEWVAANGAAPLTRMSINVEGTQLADDEFVLNHDLTNADGSYWKGILAAILKTKLFVPTGKTVSYGYVKNQPIWWFRRPEPAEVFDGE